jgi:hypothetical protein
LGEGIRGRFFAVKILKFKPSEMAFPGILQRPISFLSRKISTDRKFPENIISTSKFVSAANHILQNFLSAENFPEWKWFVVLLCKIYVRKARNLPLDISATRRKHFGL